MVAPAKMLQHSVHNSDVRLG